MQLVIVDAVLRLKSAVSKTQWFKIIMKKDQLIADPFSF
jgi:hypothetical protein